MDAEPPRHRVRLPFNFVTLSDRRYNRQAWASLKAGASRMTIRQSKAYAWFRRLDEAHAKGRGRSPLMKRARAGMDVGRPAE